MLDLYKKVKMSDDDVQDTVMHFLEQLVWLQMSREALASEIFCV